MNALEVSKRAIDAWNRHDADALAALYAEGATYHNPRMDNPLTGKAIANFAKSVWAAYPDASLEIISRGDTGEGLVATQFVLHGTHTGPYFDGSPPTGRTVAYPVASFAQIEGDKIRSEHIYLDRQTVAEQLGLKSK